MFLNDNQLKALIAAAPPLVSKFPGAWDSLPLDNKRWDAADSPVQPASVDLHVGEIFLPGEKKGKQGSVGNGALSHTLPSGHSVVVHSHETISLPPDIGAIALPPSRISSKGILIANFGHVDPGYEGRMRFTIINMGKSDYPLNKGEDIITMLFFRIKTADASWKSRNPTPRHISQSEVDFLAKDFADIDNRVAKLTKQALGESGYRYVLSAYVLPVAIGVAVSWLSFMFAVYLQFQTKVETLTVASNKLESSTIALQDKMVRLDKAQDGLDAFRKHEQDDLSKRLSSLEDRTKASNPSEMDAIMKRFDALEFRFNSLSPANTGKP